MYTSKAHIGMFLLTSLFMSLCTKLQYTYIHIYQSRCMYSRTGVQRRPCVYIQRERGWDVCKREKILFFFNLSLLLRPSFSTCCIWLRSSPQDLSNALLTLFLIDMCEILYHLSSFFFGFEHWQWQRLKRLNSSLEKSLLTF